MNNCLSTSTGLVQTGAEAWGLGKLPGRRPMLVLLVLLILAAGNSAAGTAAPEGNENSSPAHPSAAARGWREPLMQLPEWKNLSEQQKRKLRNNFQRFQQLPQAQRRKLKKLFRKFKNLPPEKRQLLLEKFRRFQRLPAAKRKRIWRRLKNMSAGQRRKFLFDEK